MSKLDENCFKALYKQYEKDVRQFLEDRRVRRADQDDLVQEVFVIAARKYDPAWHAKAWLLIVAHRVEKNWRRLAYHREQPGYPAEPVDPYRSPEQYVSDVEIRGRVHSIIDDSMDDELRLVFTLVRLEGTPIEQVAEMLNIPYATVQSMLRRADKAFIKEGRRRHAAGALLTLSLAAASAESRVRAGIKECFKCAGSAVAGAGVMFALMRTPAASTPIHAEPPLLTETRWNLAPLPPVVDMPQPKAIDPMPPSPHPQPPPVDVIGTMRDELMLIERATLAIDNGSYEEALRYLDRHRSRYPDGQSAPLRVQLFHRLKQLTGRSTKSG